MKILVVDDNREILDFLKPGLESEGFVVDTCDEGEKGSYLARTNEYELIVLDNVLPGKDGRQICAEIRSTGNHVPIIILSVRSDADEKAELLNLGADDYLVKPFVFAELIARIRALLRRPRLLEKNILRAGNIKLDCDARKVLIGKTEIKLTSKEFGLLEYMMKNRGRVLSRAMILEHVWDARHDFFSNTIETHILNLRKKMERKDIGVRIATVQGLGYKLD